MVILSFIALGICEILLCLVVYAKGYERAMEEHKKKIYTDSIYEHFYINDIKTIKHALDYTSHRMNKKKHDHCGLRGVISEGRLAKLRKQLQ